MDEDRPAPASRLEREPPLEGPMAKDNGTSPSMNWDGNPLSTSMGT
jgi:hypothetical protein